MNRYLLANISLFYMIWFCQVYQKEEKEAAMLARKQKSYTLIDADDDDDHDDGGQVPHVVKSHKLDSRQKRFRKKSENEDIDDEEA